MGAEEPVIVAKKLTVGYPEKHKNEPKTVLHDLNFAIYAGHITALVGPNGAGKSSLINTIIGINEPLSGSIQVRASINARGRSQNGFSGIGFCAQTQVIDWYTSVKTNVTSGPKLAGIFGARAQQFAHDAMAIMDIGELAERPVDHLSGGQQQRVQVARELARMPSIYILDEPTTGLDVESAEKLFEYLKQQAAAVVVSSHDLTIVEKYADDLLLIDSGRIDYCGRMRSFIQRGEDATFIDVQLARGSGQIPDALKGIGQLTGYVLSVPLAYGMTALLKMLVEYHVEVESISVRKPTLREMYINVMGARH